MPPFEELDRYLRGEMGSEERKRLEGKIQEDPMLADMIEGLEAVKDPKLIQQSLSRITAQTQRKLAYRNNKRDQLQKRRSRVQPRTYHQLSMAVAAGMAFLIVSVWLFRKIPGNTSAMEADQLITMKMEAPPAESAPMMEKSLPLPPIPDIREEAEEVESEPPADQSFASISSEGEAEQAAPSPSQTIGNSLPGNAGPVASAAVEAEEEIALLAEAKEQGKAEEEARREAERMLMARQESRRAREQEQKLAQGRALTEATALPPSPAPSEIQSAAPISVDSAIASQDSDFLNVSEIPEDRTPEISNGGGTVVQSDQTYSSDEISNSIGLDVGKRSVAKAKKNRMDDSEYPVSSWKHAYAGLPRMTDEERLQGELMRAGAMAEILEEAIQLYNQADYAGSRFKLDEVLLSSPENVVAKYFMASSYVLEERYEAAMPYYREVINYPEGTFYQDARWELANAYLELGKKRQARKLLVRIAEQAGDYQEAAQAQLKKLR